MPPKSKWDETKDDLCTYILPETPPETIAIDSSQGNYEWTYNPDLPPKTITIDDNTFVRYNPCSPNYLTNVYDSPTLTEVPIENPHTLQDIMSNLVYELRTMLGQVIPRVHVSYSDCLSSDPLNSTFKVGVSFAGTNIEHSITADACAAALANDLQRKILLQTTYETLYMKLLDELQTKFEEINSL